MDDRNLLIRLRHGTTIVAVSATVAQRENVGAIAQDELSDGSRFHDLPVKVVAGFRQGFDGGGALAVVVAGVVGVVGT